MLDWLTGATRSPEAHNTHNIGFGEGRSFFEEPPETPAHLFAVKAFKSALFGTPAPRDRDETVMGRQTPKSPRTGPKAAVVPEELPTTDAITSQMDTKPIIRPKLDALASPAKGILLTPGTAATRRKTVSFGKSIDLAEDNVANEAKDIKSTVNEHGSPASGLPRAFQKSRRREASLRRTLFQTRPDTADAKETSPQTASNETEPPSLLSDSVTDDKAGKGDNGDITIDLKHPLSRSGQHWKKEYQRDHERSKREMRKLIQYSHTAKSYAHKRDAEALELGEKLKRAESKVEEMERRVSELASQLVTANVPGRDAPSNQTELLNELATQTTRALRYKEKAEKCKVAIHDHATANSTNEVIHNDEGQKSKPVSTTSDGKQGCTEDLGSLHTEISNLRKVAKRAESKAAALERENLSLKNTITRVKQKMNDYESRHAAEKERRRRKDEKHEAKVEALKKELEQYKLRDLQPPVTALHRKPRRLDEDTKSKSLQQHLILDNLNVPRLGPNETENEKQGSNNSENLQAPPVDPPQQSLKGSNTEPHSGESRGINSLSFQDSIDVWTAAVNNSGDLCKPTAQSRRLEHAIEAPLRQAFPGDDGVSLQDIALKVSQLKIPVYPEDGRPHYQSPSLPFRDFAPNSRANTLSKLASSRASSLSARPPLPPERVEAAKRRLEQRNAEKSKGAYDGKENQTP